MGMLERLSDARGTLEGKIVAVILAILLVLPVASVTAFAGDHDEDDATTPTEQVEQSAPVEKQVVEETEDKGAVPVIDPQSEPETTPTAPVVEPADPEQSDGVVDEATSKTIGLDISKGTLVLIGKKTFGTDDKNIVLSTQNDIKFTVEVADDYKLVDEKPVVFVTSDDQEIALDADADGVYTIESDSVENLAKLVVKAEPLQVAYKSPARASNGMDYYGGGNQGYGQRNHYTVTFICDDEHQKSLNTSTYDYWEGIWLPQLSDLFSTMATTNEEGQIFRGWATASEPSEYTVPGKWEYLDQNTTYYSVWTEPTVSYYSNGSEITGSNITTSYPSGAECILPNADDFDSMNAKDGQTFVGWSVGSEKTDYDGKNNDGIYFPGEVITITNDTNVYAVWSDISTTDAYFFIRTDGVIPQEPAAVGDNSGKAQYIPNGNNQHTLAGTVSNPVFSFSRSGISSEYLASQPSKEDVYNKLKEYNVNNDHIKISQYSDFTSFDSDYDVVWYVLKMPAQSCTIDGKSHWHIDGIVKAKEKVTLGYDLNIPNGETFEGSIPLNVQYPKNTKGVAVDNAVGFSWPGHEFLGWNTAPDGTGKSYAAGSTIDLGEEDVTLYAQWKTPEDITFTYKAYTNDEESTEGGRVSVNTNNINPINGVPLESVATAEDGYAFIGWYEVVDGQLVLAENAVRIASNPDENGFVTTGLTPQKKEGEQRFTSRTFVAKFVSVGIDGYRGVYDGYSHSPNVSTDAIMNSFENLQVQYKSDDGNWSTEIPSYANVKTEDGVVASDLAYPVEARIVATVNGVEAVVCKGLTTEVIIEPALLTVTTKTDSKRYDGTPLTAGGEYSGLVTFKDADGNDVTETVKFETTGSVTYVSEGTVDNTYTIAFEGEEGSDGATAKRTNYVIEEELGKLSIVEADLLVKITGEDATFTYNGTPQSVSGYKYELVAGEGVSTSNLGVQWRDGASAPTVTETNADTYAMNLSNSDFSLTGTAAGNFSNVEFVVVKDGSLTIKQRPVKVIGHSITPDVTYDGESHDTTDYDVEEFNEAGKSGIVSGHNAVASYKLTGKNASPNPYIGVFENGVGNERLTITDADGNDVTANYEPEFEPGSLKITQKDITTPTDPDDPDNPATPVLTVEGLRDETYNGTEWVKKPTVVRDDNGNELVEGTDYELSYSGDKTNVTDEGVTVTITGKGNYTGTYDVGYKILPVELTVTAESDGKVYDGKELTQSKCKVEGLIEVDGVAETVKALAKGSRTDVGEAYNEVDKVMFAGEEGADDATAKRQNYTLKPFIYGKLAITHAPVVVTAIASGKVYGGEEPELSAKVEGMVNGESAEEKIKYQLSRAQGEDVGSYDITVTGDVYQGNYKVSYVNTALNSDGNEETIKFTVSQADLVVTVVGNTGEKVYNGTEQFVEGYEQPVKLSAANGLDADGLEVALADGKQAKASGTDVIYNEDGTFGNYLMGLTKDDFKLTGDNAKNFKIAEFVVNDGWLTITPKNITPSVDPENPDNPATPVLTVEGLGDETYNGSPWHKAPVVKDGDRVLELGKDYTLSYSGDETNVTDAGVTVTIIGIGNYKGAYEVGYKINPREVTIIVNSDAKTVGQADPAFTGEIRGLVADNHLGAVTYWRTNADVQEVGDYADVLMASYADNPNYTVTVVPGDFAIVPVGAPVVPPTPPTPGPLDALVTTVTDFLATPIIGPGAMAAEGIADGETPLAQIDDEGNPLSAFDHPVCWVHYYILLGIIITAIYGGGVIARRLGYNHTIKKYEDDVTGESRNSEPLKKPVAKEGTQPTI